MALRLLGHVELPANRSSGGFDHADIHPPTDRLYVAHTCNDSIDVIDCARDRYVESITGLTAVAGALVSEARGLVFTSNRGENTVSVFAPGAERDAFKIGVGVRPNGLAFDAARGILLAANVGDTSLPDSHTVSIVDIGRRERIAEIKVPGRTRWAIYDPGQETFFVNIASPARIIAFDAREPTKISKAFEVPEDGPHGLDFDPVTGRLLCACDAGVLVALDAGSGRILADVPLSGVPDVIFLHSRSRRLYVAIGEPEVIDVIDIDAMRRQEVMPTEPGAHTLALDRMRNKIYAFLPQSHRAAVFVEFGAHPVKRVMEVDGVDWLIDAPIPCPKCGKEAVVNVVVLKARDSIACRYCGTAIDLTNPSTRAYLEEFTSVVASLLSGSNETAKKS